VQASPSKALSILEADVAELISTGMLNFDVKLTGIDNDKFLTRLVEVWNFFWVQVLPYVEGVRLVVILYLGSRLLAHMSYVGILASAN
jgi:hypothetical protein